MQRSVEQRLAQANRREWGGHLANVAKNFGYGGLAITLLSHPEILQQNSLQSIVIPVALVATGFISNLISDRLYKQANQIRTASDLSTSFDLDRRREKRERVVDFLAFAPVTAVLAHALVSFIAPEGLQLAAPVLEGLAIMYSVGSAIKSGAEAHAITRRLH